MDDFLRGRDGRDGRQGDAGESAYKLACRFGYQGTEIQWLRGLQGKDGANGESAYRTAVRNGFVGGESDWLACLKGAKGEPGQKGLDGKDAPVPVAYRFQIQRDAFDRMTEVIVTPIY
jgi:hypothetical protein